MTDLVPPPAPPPPRLPPGVPPWSGPEPVDADPPVHASRVTEVGPLETVDVRSHPWATAVGVVGLLIVVVLGVVALGARIEDRDGGVEVDQVVLPRLTGRPLSDAQAELERRGMIVDVRYEPNELVAPDVVVGQEPVAGARLEVGRQVVLAVSDGPAGVTVPGLSGLSAPEAVRLLSALGLVGVPELVYDEVAPVGEIAGSLPAPGGRALPGDQIRLQVSMGPEPRTVPDVVGLSSPAAFAALGRSDLQIAGVTRRTTTDAAPGTVLAVEPSAGEEVPRDTPVRVVVAVASEPGEFPDLVGLTEESARRVAAELGVRVSVSSESIGPDDPRDGFVIRQTPVAGTPADSGAVSLVVGVALPPPPPPTTTTVPDEDPDDP